MKGIKPQVLSEQTIIVTVKRDGSSGMITYRHSSFYIYTASDGPKNKHRTLFLITNSSCNLFRCQSCVHINKITHTCTLSVPVFLYSISPQGLDFIDIYYKYRIHVLSCYVWFRFTCKIKLTSYFVTAKTSYDPNKMLCCTNVLIKRQISNYSKCCNNTEIDASDTECCMGVPFNNLNQQCCGGKI